MPTNLPPECQKIEERYRAADTPEEKIACLEELLATIPKHKGTDHLRADYRRKLAKLKEASETGKGAGRYTSPFHIDKEGAGQVVLVGPTNAGKSALVKALTNAIPEVGDYPFTTWTPTPGMMTVENVQVQLIDTRYEGQSGSTFTPLLVVVNKCDDAEADEDFRALCDLLEEDWPMIPVSATMGRNFDGLKQAVFERLEIMRVYSKPPGREADLSTPFVLKKGSTVEDLAGKVHKDFLENLKSARVWGSAAFDGQMVSRDHVLQDGDVVELRT